MQRGRDDADGCFDSMFACSDATEMLQGSDDADHAVAAHAEQADVVEKDDTSRARSVCGLHEQGSDDDFVAAWFAYDGTAVCGEKRVRWIDGRVSA